MELAISAVTSDLVSRFITFLMSKISDRVCSDPEGKLERLQGLLLRVQTVVEEADGRYLTNPCMLAQLKTLAAALYRGYHVLDTIRYRQHKEVSNELVSESLSSRLKRSRTLPGNGVMKSEVFNLKTELQSAVGNLETVADNMAEFVIHLSGCDRISRRPYDTYLYIDNFMFGRHAEKQQLVNFLLHHDLNQGPLAVLPVIGGHRVGKKTLVAHVCGDERVRSHFCHTLHLNGDNFLRISDHERKSGKGLVVVEFVSDVDESDWAAFHTSLVKYMDRGSKVIIISQIKKLGRFGTVMPMLLNTLVYEEFRYLFKTLAFGSANPLDYPALVQIVDEFPMLMGQSFIYGNVVADVLRRNLTVHFWLCRLNAIRWIVTKNISMFGAHPYTLFSEQGRSVHLTDFVLSDAASVASDSKMAIGSISSFPKVFFRDIINGLIVPPKGVVNLVAWESRIPPYSSFGHMVQFTAKHVDGMRERTISGRKRRAAVFT